VLLPTRELAAQCEAMGKQLARFSDIRLCLVVGGLSVKLQEAEMRTRCPTTMAHTTMAHTTYLLSHHHLLSPDRSTAV
jgi:superfamily II DNA/RNA helicase